MHNLLNSKTFLFTPAHKCQLFIKSIESGADAIVFDLEDSCPPNFKKTVHSKLVKQENILKQNPFIYRINDLRTPFGLKDILFIIESKLKPYAIIVPNVENVDMINTLRRLLKNIKLISTIESPRGLQFAYKIALVSDALIFGSADYSSSFGVYLNFDNLAFPRNTISVAAAAANIPAIDTACFKIHDKVHLEKECNFIRNIGFSGKAAIHPFQVETINRLLSPPQENIKWAKKIINSVEGVSNLNGDMVGPPFIKIAEKILKKHKQQQGEK